MLKLNLSKPQLKILSVFYWGAQFVSEVFNVGMEIIMYVSGFSNFTFIGFFLHRKNYICDYRLHNSSQCNTNIAVLFIA